MFQHFLKSLFNFPSDIRGVFKC